MSGIAGIYNSKFVENSKQDIQTTLDAMTHALLHRGPDSQGIWIDSVYGIGLGHRRLALYDSSPAGHEPMVSSCGRYVMVCDGDIYERAEIIKNLAQCQRYLKSKSSTEIILESCAQWGVEAALQRLNGAFAFALYDKADQTLILARDKIGVKPLYYGYFNGLLIFGSELKALRANPDWQPKLNRNSVATFLNRKYIPTPESIYENVYKLQQACILKINQQGKYKITPYWDLRTLVESNATIKSDLSLQELITKLHTLLSSSVKQCMSGNGPLGAFLSSGVDSSLIAALMKNQSSQPINTFTIGFHENNFDEAPHAKKIAKHLGTHHTQLYVDANDALTLAQNISKYYDEPAADQAQIPTIIMCEMAKQHANIVLSGESADTLLGGMNNFHVILDTWKKSNRLPYPIRQMMGHMIRAMPAVASNCINNKLKSQLQIKTLEDAYRMKYSFSPNGETVVKNTHESKQGIWWDNSLGKFIPDPFNRMMAIHMQTIIPDLNLAKQDRAAAQAALEVRSPFLDDRILEFAAQIPDSFKFKDKQMKWGLHQILYQYVPQNLIDLPKNGFSVPMYMWLRGPLKDWAENLLSEERLKSQDLFEYPIVRKHWEKFCKSDTRAGVHFIWSVLMMQTWIDANPEVSL